MTTSGSTVLSHIYETLRENEIKSLIDYFIDEIYRILYIKYYNNNMITYRNVSYDKSQPLFFVIFEATTIIIIYLFLFIFSKYL